MRIEGSGRYETPKEANYTYIKYVKKYQEHILRNNHTGENEIFVSCPHFAGWGLVYKNTVLEFVSTIN